jgi:hypothetical protein
MILAIAALFASACLTGALARELPSLALRPTPHAERLAGRTLRPSAHHSGAQRPALVRSALTAVARVKTSDGTGTDGPRSSEMLVEPAERFELAAIRARGGAVEARSHGVRSPGQPAPSSRAPPIG